jgi:ADP-glucose pyrophosphorylase
VSRSIIYPGVSIGEKSVIEKSIILPNTRIGAGAKIIRSVIDERSSREGEGPNIGDRCRIGTDSDDVENGDFPRALFNGLTLIGKDCDIPDGSSVGGACYVASGMGREFFSRSKCLYNGTSIIKRK